MIIDILILILIAIVAIISIKLIAWILKLSIKIALTIGILFVIVKSLAP